MAGKVSPDCAWRVVHPVHGETVVRAPDWRLATVEAAEWWGVRWGAIAAECEVEKIGDIPRNVCIDCGRIFHGSGLRCEICACKARDYEASLPANTRRYWREMWPR